MSLNTTSLNTTSLNTASLATPPLSPLTNPTHERFGCLSPLSWREGRLHVLDQLALPTTTRFYEVSTWREAAWTIKSMAVRGAPAIGITAAYGLALAAQEFAHTTPHVGAHAEHEAFVAWMCEAAEGLYNTRPTAVNLSWALKRLQPLWEEERATHTIAEALLSEALAVHEEDIEMCKAMGAWGASLMTPNTKALTHCNTGALATGGYGTALGVMRAGWERGLLERVYADETRPYLQGARLTMWELMRDELPCSMLCDNMAAYMMQRGEIDSVWVGADRITAQGDTANKIGTYGLALIAHAHNIPFYVVAPTSTVDLTLSEGSEIPIERRPAREMTHVGATQIAPEGASVENPAFDVTPHRYITAIITEQGVAQRGEDGSYRQALTAHVKAR